MKESILANNKKAFSLIELMFSLVVLIIILVGLLYAFVVNSKLNESSRNLTLINSAMQAHLESIEDNFLNDLTYSIDEYFPLINAPDNPDVDDGVDGALFRTVSRVCKKESETGCTLENDYSNLKLVKLVACWKEGNRLIGNNVKLDPEGKVVRDNVNERVSSTVELVTIISMKY